MSTNINSSIPDASFLEQLANQLFSATPGQSVGNTPSTASIYPDVAKQEPGLGGGVDGVPASIAGSGVSPSAINQRNAVDLKSPQTSLEDPNVPSGNIPASVAGSGISPSVSGNDPFRIVEDTSGWNKPAANGYGFIPASQKENGFSILDSNFSSGVPLQTNYQGWEEISPFQKELESALGNIHSYVPSSQIPIQSSGWNTPQYYFSSDFIAPFLDTPNESGGGILQAVRPPFDVNFIRNDFPILSEIVDGKRLVWLDNAATTQKPKQVFDRIGYYYAHENSNVHRAAHTLAARSTDAYEEARKIVKDFIHARSTNEIVFVRGTTEAINLIAQSWGDQNLKEGDEIIVSHLEHHANIVPWQILSQKKGLKLKVIPVDDNGELILSEFEKLLTPKTKLVSVTAVSNALGTVNPIKQIIDTAHAAGAKVLVDGAQSISHIRTDVQALDADWFVFSGHKIYGPTGIGVVYGKEEILNATQPWQGGGNMIKDVTFQHTEYNAAPTRFEAGTGNIADAVGLGAALKYVSQVGIDLIHQYESALIKYTSNRLKTVPGLRIIGNAKEKAGAISFVLDKIDTVKIGGLLSKEGIAVRAGHHCAQPILRRFGLEATVRPSFAFYNTCSDIDALIDAVQKISARQLQ